MIPEVFQHLFHHRRRFRKQMPSGMFLPPFDSPEKILGRLFSETRQVGNAAIATGLLQIGNTLHLQRFPQNLDLFRAKPLKLEELRQAIRKTAAKLLVIAKLAGGREFFDLLRYRGTDPFQFFEAVLRYQVRKVAGKSLQGSSRVRISANLERVLPLQLEQP